MANGDVTYEQDNNSLDDNGEGKTGDFHIGYQLVITNDEGAELPSAGGPGTGLFTALGFGMIAGAGVMSIRRRRHFQKRY